MAKLSMEDLLKGRPTAAGANSEDTRPGLPPVSPGGNVQAPLPAPTPSKFMIGGGVILVIILSYLVYGFFTLQEGQKALYAELQQLTEQTRLEREDLRIRTSVNESNITGLEVDSKLIQDKVGVTQAELNRARAQVDQFKQQQAQTVAQIKASLAKKAETTQLTALKLDSDQKFGNVTKNVSDVRTDVEATKEDLDDTQRQLLDVRDTLSSQIATTKDELEILRRMGQREYIEFTTVKNRIIPVHDIRLQLKKTNRDKAEYNLVILVDDQKLEKKNRSANEPIQFLVGKNKVRYEIVVNSVTRNRIEGYLSIPKDSKLSAERPVGGQ